MYTIKGKIKVIKPTVQVTEKFSKRDLVITSEDDLYPQHISFQMAQDKCAILDGYSEGEDVEVSFNLRGREWTSPQNEVKHFNTLDAWRIEKISSQATSTPQESKMENIPTGNIERRFQDDAIDAMTEDDDLPF